MLEYARRDSGVPRFALQYLAQAALLKRARRGAGPPALLLFALGAVAPALPIHIRAALCAVCFILQSSMRGNGRNQHFCKRPRKLNKKKNIQMQLPALPAAPLFSMRAKGGSRHLQRRQR